MPVIARLLLAFRNAEVDYFGPKLIVHDFCRGSLNTRCCMVGPRGLLAILFRRHKLFATVRRRCRFVVPQQPVNGQPVVNRFAGPSCHCGVVIDAQPKIAVQYGHIGTTRDRLGAGAHLSSVGTPEFKRLVVDGIHLKSPLVHESMMMPA